MSIAVTSASKMRCVRIATIVLWVAIIASAAACRRHAPVPASTAPVLASAPTAQVQASQRVTFEVLDLVHGLEHPWALAFLPDGSMLVTERPGRLYHIVFAAQPATATPVSGLPTIFVDGQAGLLDIALSPDFANDQWVYLSYAEPNLRGNKAGTAVARGRLQGNALHDLEAIYRQEPKLSSGTHVGSRLVFDGAGHLFVTTGDNRVAPTAQQLDKLQGKLVRLNPDGTIPKDNPFVGRDDARPEIWSYGHRNMQGAALHPVTGKVWTSEHGPMGGDELNIPQAGHNYGWPVITHGQDYNGRAVDGSVGKSAEGMEPPHHVWAVSPALSGMLFYSGKMFPEWRGNLFLGALAKHALIRLELDGDRVLGEERLLEARESRIRDVREGPDGAIYLVVDHEKDGRILRLQRSAGTAAP